MATDATTRNRADVEQDIRSKRRERALYVSPAGVDAVHAQIDKLLDEWEAADERLRDIP